MRTIRTESGGLLRQRARRQALPKVRNRVRAALLLALALGAAHGSLAQEPSITVKIRDHHFYPSEFEVPAGKRQLLTIENEDATAEEFESQSLHREKLVAAKSTATISIGPLKPGRYEFVGEFHEATAKGAVLAK